MAKKNVQSMQLKLKQRPVKRQKEVKEVTHPHHGLQMKGSKIGTVTDHSTILLQEGHYSQGDLGADLAECIDIVGGIRVRGQVNLNTHSSQHVTIRGSEGQSSLQSLGENDCPVAIRRSSITSKQGKSNRKSKSSLPILEQETNNANKNNEMSYGRRKMKLG